MLCFAGLRFPAGLKNALMDIVRVIETHPDTKPMDAAMIHCTVAFYGKVSHQRKVEIRKQVAALDPPPPGDVTIVGLDQFPDKKRNLVVARLAVPDEWMRARDEFVAASGGDGREQWAPHVTLGKLRHPERFRLDQIPLPPQTRFSGVRFDLEVRP